MQHQGSPHAGAEVSRALGQIAEPVVKGKMQLLIQPGVQLIGQTVRLIRRHAGEHHLQPQMVLFVEHQAHRFVLRQQQGAALAAAGKFRADQVTFH